MIEQFFTFAGELFHTFSKIIMELLYPMASTDNNTVIELETVPPKPDLPIENSEKSPATASDPSKTITIPSDPKNASNGQIKPTLSDFLKWQWQLEGAVPANNNPGNYKFFYGGYMPIYGNVKRSVGGFAMFPTLAQGELYAATCTKGVIKHHPELTILTYLGGNGDWPGYAPSSDRNNPLDYATFVSSHLGVGINFLMKDLA